MAFYNTQHVPLAVLYGKKTTTTALKIHSSHEESVLEECIDSSEDRVERCQFQPESNLVLLSKGVAKDKGR